jgi:hypothetical protein
MTDTSIIQGRGPVEAPVSAVSWGAILAGAVASSALSLILITLGFGIGLVSVSPWSNSGASATTIGMLAVAWSIAVPLISYAVGGYLAGRLRTGWVGAHTDEVFFRDTAHGMLVWALGTILSAALLASVLSSVTSGVTRAGAAAVGGAGAAVASAVSSVAKDADPASYFNDMLFRSQQPPAQGDATASRAEVGRIVGKSLLDGDMSDADKAYVAQVVARQTGLNQADAEKRVSDVIAQAKTAAQQAADKAKQAADAARKVGVYAALWAFIALLIGAFSASYLATVGGRIRDDLPAAG